MSGRTTSSLAQQAEHRELVVCGDGPLHPMWLWRDALETAARSSRTMGHPDDHPAAWWRHYAATDEFVAHPIEPGVSGRVWRYQPPTGAES